MVIATAVLTRVLILAGLVLGKHGDVGAAISNGAAHTYDAAWFDHIVQRGYADTGPHVAYPAFFPGYPALVGSIYWPLHAVLGLFPMGPLQASAADGWLLPASTLIVCNLSLAAALVLLWKLYQPRLGASATAVGLCLLLSWPSALFLSVGYSEASFLVLAAGSLLLAERGRWVWAGALGGAACLVRLPGLFLVLPLFLILLRSPRRAFGPAAAGAILFSVGAFGYHVYLWMAFGDPMTYLHAQAAGWGRGTGGVGTALSELWTGMQGSYRWLADGTQPWSGRNPALVSLLKAGAVGGAVTAVLLGRRWLRTWEVAWILAVMAVPLATGTALSVNRYLLVAFPVFMVWGYRLRRRPAMVAIIVVLLGLWTFEQADEFARVLLVG